MSLSESENSNVVECNFGGKSVTNEDNLTERVLAEIRKEPRTVEQVSVACDVTEKQVRNAVTALRRKYQADDINHIVSYKRMFWTAAELERRGHTMQPTARGTLKVTGSTKTKQGDGGKKKAKKTEKAKSRDEIAAHVLEELGDSPDAQKVAKLIVAKYDAFLEADGELPRVRQRARDMIKASEAAFKEAIEEGIALHDEEAALQKLHNVEQAWQNKLERHAEAIELRKEANDVRKRARDAFSGVMENIRQLDLFADMA